MGQFDFCLDYTSITSLHDLIKQLNSDLSVSFNGYKFTGSATPF